MTIYYGQKMSDHATDIAIIKTKITNLEIYSKITFQKSIITSFGSFLMSNFSEKAVVDPKNKGPYIS